MTQVLISEQFKEKPQQDIKISVITVCKNSEAYIEKAIQSVINQTYKNIEYIVIDGDSQDKTKDIIQNYSKHIDKFISEPDTGIYNAMNKGIKLATGSFIQFLNSDDYFYDNKVVEDVVQFIQQNPDCDIVYGDAEIRRDPRIGGDPYIAKSPLPSEIPEAIICGNLFLQGSIFFRGTTFNELGFFNEKYTISADYEYYIRFTIHNKILVYYCSRTIFSYYTGGISGNVTKTLSEMFDIQNGIDMFKSEDWCQKRILKLQSSIIELRQFIYDSDLAHQSQREFISRLNNPWFALKMAIRSFLVKYIKLKKEKFL